MSSKINWLHLSDVHLGQSEQQPLWPKFRHEFYRDLKTLATRFGPIEIVFFTGDFVQRGSEDEFDQASKELESLWAEIKRHTGVEPTLFAVPGNHDLVRPPAISSVSIALRQWHNQPEVRDQFWQDEGSELRQATRQHFNNYVKWLSRLQIPQPQLTRGILPGDFSANFKSTHASIGVVGLNSTFLQIANGDFQRKLDLSVRQLNSVCAGDPDRWLQKNDLNVLLTHQPPSWFCDAALRDFQGEIYPPDRFFAHLCGHQHVVEVTDVSHGGSTPRRLRQAPSLFGLEKTGDAIVREHGYLFGHFEISDAQLAESIIPRHAVRGLNGTLRLRPDQRFDLNSDDAVIIRIERENQPQVPAPAPERSTSVPPSTLPNVLEQIDTAQAEANISACPKFEVSREPQHCAIRLGEQAAVEAALRHERIAWIVADWGVGKDEFFRAVLTRFNGAEGRVFHFDSEAATDTDTLLRAFHQQFGISISAFATNLSVPALGQHFLIIDNVPADLIQAHSKRLADTLTAVRDYCPVLHLLISSRAQPPPELKIQPIELLPLEVPDVRSYVLAHPISIPGLDTTEHVEKLHVRSDGITAHIDRLLRAMKVSSISSVLDEEIAASPVVQTGTDSLPPSLISAISNLARNAERTASRSFKLLKVLAILPYGETIDSLRHFLPSEPFFADHALLLKDLTLLDVIPLGAAAPEIRLPASSSEGNAAKVLKVPRQVRDYVFNVISEEEKREFISAGLELYFGRKWRNGKPRIRSVPIDYQAYLDHGPGNEFHLIYDILHESIAKADSAGVRRASKLVLFYCEHLKRRDRFHDLVLVGSSFTKLLDQWSDRALFAQVAELYATGLRMVGHADEALRYFEQVWAAQEFTSSRDKAALWVKIGFCHVSLDRPEDARKAAQKIDEFSPEKSAFRQEAEWIRLQVRPKSAERTADMRQLEKAARTDGNLTIANNLALDLSSDAADLGTKRTYVQSVLESGESGYNACRAIVAKGKALKSAGVLSELSSSDRRELTSAYAYLHAQRFGSLFDNCHEVLWGVLETEGNSDQLLRLFRHSSFVWRLRGEEDLECTYAARLDKHAEQGPHVTVRTERGYLRIRLRQLSERIAKTLQGNDGLQPA
jgi:predicted MPP superfamily phosphohydrolase